LPGEPVGPEHYDLPDARMTDGGEHFEVRFAADDIRFHWLAFRIIIIGIVAGVLLNTDRCVQSQQGEAFPSSFRVDFQRLGVGVRRSIEAILLREAIAVGIESRPFVWQPNHRCEVCPSSRSHI
jgi:hypothetical protein